MSHIKLVVLIDTGEEFTPPRTEGWQFRALGAVLEDIVPKIADGTHHGHIYTDVGTKMGTWDVSEVRD